MSSNLSRFFHLLAALDLPQGELINMIYQIQRMPVRDVMDRVASCHSFVELEDIDSKKGWATKPSSPKRSSSQSVDYSIGERIERLLKIEAGLTSSEAVEKLGEMLIRAKLLEPDDLPPLSKKSLADWAARISNRVPEKDLLRHATVLRNEHAGGPESDWKLR